MSTNLVRATEKRKPPAAGKGRPKGSLNKTSKALKDMILGALGAAGGEDYLLRCAEDPKLAAAFLTLVGKVLPTTLEGGIEIIDRAEQMRKRREERLGKA